MTPLADPVAVKRKIGVCPRISRCSIGSRRAETLAFVGQVHGLDDASDPRSDRTSC